MIQSVLVIALSLASVSAFAQGSSGAAPATTTTTATTTTSTNAAHPCEDVVAACKNAKFIKGDAKTGNGLWVDCVHPLITGNPQPKKASLPLPTVDAGLSASIAACKAKNPKFAEGKH